MLIGIDASRAFQKQRTGIEEYSYQIIRHLTDKLKGHQVVLYIKKNQKLKTDKILFIPDNWLVKVISLPRFWTQVGLSLEMFFHPVDVLFIPSHTVPIVHPKNTIITIHGLEYEMVPQAYSWWKRNFLRWSIKTSCYWAKKIIAVSQNTKRDLMKLYNIPKEKVEVIYEGVNNDQRTMSNEQYGKFSINKPYLLFIGRLEKRKNIEGIIEAYKILKEKYNISHQLVLAGKPGDGYQAISNKRANLPISCKEDIILTGFISEKEKWQLLKNAAVFLFPSLYEGFGLPILESQSQGVPVVTSNISSLPEVAGEGAAYCDPHEPTSIAEAIYKVISDESFKNAIIKEGQANVRLFSWEKCAVSIAKLLAN